MNLPTEHDINPIPGDPDGEDAVKMFLGKSLDEAEKLFLEDTGLSRIEDLSWMGPVGFMFYFQAALRYLKNPMSAKDSCFASSMTRLLESRVIEQHEDYDQIKKARANMLEFCQHLMNNYDFYDIDPDIYGDLRPRLKKLLEKLKAEES